MSEDLFSSTCDINTTHICCISSDKYNKFFDSEMNVFDVMINIWGLISILFLLFHLRPSANKYTMLRFYQNVLLSQAMTYVGILLANFLSMVFVGSDDAVIREVVFVLISICFASQWFAQIGIVVFMFQKNIDRKHTIQTISTTAIMVTVSMAIIYILHYLPRATSTTGMYLKMHFLGIVLVEILFCIGYFAVCLSYIKCLRFKQNARNAGLLWSIFQFFTHGTYSVYYTLVLFSSSTTIFGFCLKIILESFCYLLFPLMLYKTVKADTYYWRRKGSLLRSTAIIKYDDLELQLEELFQSGMKRINWEDIEIIRVIGAGSFGDVYYGKLSKKSVAVKVLKINDQEAIAELVKECIWFSKLVHPNIVRFLGVTIDEPNISIVTEFVKRGSLWGIMRHSPEDLIWKVRVKILRQVAKGMKFLHSCTPVIIHRDLKSGNVLLDLNWEAKLCDFGLSRVKTASTKMTRVGTPQWAAPEILRDDIYSEKADVYSYGILLWEIVTLRIPFEEINSMRLIYLVASSQERPYFPESIECSAPLRDLITRCWSEDPEERPTMKEICTITETRKMLPDSEWNGNY